MDHNVYAMSFRIDGAEAIHECTGRVLGIVGRAGGRGEEPASVFRIKLVLNELLTHILRGGGSASGIGVNVYCRGASVQIDIDNACKYADQLVRLYRRQKPGNGFDEEQARLVLLREMADDLVLSARRDRLTVTVLTS